MRGDELAVALAKCIALRAVGMTPEFHRAFAYLQMLLEIVKKAATPTEAR